MDMANKPNDPTGAFDKDDAADLDQTYTAGKSNVVKAARERKRGGKCDMKAEGGKAPKRMDRPKRASGGKISQNWEAAQKTSDRPGADIQSKSGMD